MNLRGLDFEHNTDLAWLKPGEPRRMFMGGGSDAHGDLNYRRAGYFLGTDDANDTAIGKPRNLVFAGNPEGPVISHTAPQLVLDNTSTVSRGAGPSSSTTVPSSMVKLALPPPAIGGGLNTVLNGIEIRPHTQEQIIRALRKGQFSVTDGPAIRTAIDKNGNKQIDPDDVQMGDIYSLQKPLFIGSANPVGGQTVTFITEIVSTSEFGPILDVDLYVGVHPSTQRLGSKEPVEPRMYAPLIHGPQGGHAVDGHVSQVSYESHGRNYVRLKDNYWNGDFLDTLTWQQIPGDPLRYSLTLVTTLHLDNYEVGKGISADRFFVRAFAHTAGNALHDIPDRYAFSNPIWIVRQGLFNTGVGTIGAALAPLKAATISASRDPQGQVLITFTGTCQYSPKVGQPFNDLPEAKSPYRVPTTMKSGFFRARE